MLSPFNNLSVPYLFMSSIDVFLFSSAPSGPQKTLILGFDSDFFHILPPHSQSSHRQNSCFSLGVSGISNLVMCAKRVILSLSNQFPSLELHNREQNGRVDDLSASKVKGELHKCLNGPVTVATVLLPRGLINSGNLCFLNATLQALLSCSPFVQLLQELRTRKVPKVGYPTLGAFAEFVSEFDMPSGSSSKNKDAGVLETGRPFSPAMFEGVL